MDDKDDFQLVPPTNPEIFKDFMVQKNTQHNSVIGKNIIEEKERIKDIIITNPEYVKVYSDFPLAFCKEFIAINPEVIFHFRIKSIKRCIFAADELKRKDASSEIKNEFIRLITSCKFKEEMCKTFGNNWENTLLYEEGDMYKHARECRLEGWLKA